MIGQYTIDLSESNQSVHGFLTRTVNVVYAKWTVSLHQPTSLSPHKEHGNLGSTVRKHIKYIHGLDKPSLNENFSILRRRRNTLDCLIYEILFIKELSPSLNLQSDSIRARVFLYNMSNYSRILIGSYL